MPMIQWDETSPTGGSYLSDLGAKWRSVKSSVDSVMQQHFYWSDSTSSAGEPRFSTTTPGSCRAYIGDRSTVSHPGRDGSLMYVSDETRLLVFTPSAESVVVSSQAAIAGFRSTTYTALANCRWLVQRSTATLATGDNKVDFPTAYAVAPLVFLAPSAGTSVSAASYIYGIFAGGGDEKSGFSVSAQYIHGGADPDDATIYWYSEGTVAL